MIEGALWKGEIRKSSPLHQSRQRRRRFGELLQIDGSHHDWFEGRREQCCLLVFVDGATGIPPFIKGSKSRTVILLGAASGLA